MENYYAILGTLPTATSQELKRIFQHLAQQYHPDKTSKNTLLSDRSDFTAILKAWKVLGDPEVRKQYDAAWIQRCTAQAQPVQDTVNVEQFEIAANGQRVFACRCGGEYELTLQDMEYRVDYLSCPSCSLCLAVQY